MSLQLILGGSGSGKTTCLYDAVIQASIKNPQQQYYVLVPGAVYHAGAEGCSSKASGSWNDEY